ncbi:hypothetical protein [Methylobacterium hispanicum]|uniref:hypothetical protein n=1 Tax=Methylobacterium hispanicum TaxID=270350 RepID=UPI002F3239CE
MTFLVGSGVDTLSLGAPLTDFYVHSASSAAFITSVDADDDDAEGGERELDDDDDLAEAIMVADDDDDVGGEGVGSVSVELRLVETYAFGNLIVR